MMQNAVITEKEKKMAEFCRSGCPVCQRARRKQGGFLFWFIKKVGNGLCPYCRAHEKVYGKKAHEQ
jgi:hypothetical protein